MKVDSLQEQHTPVLTSLLCEPADVSTHTERWRLASRIKGTTTRRVTHRYNWDDKSIMTTVVPQLLPIFLHLHCIISVRLRLSQQMRSINFFMQGSFLVLVAHLKQL